MFSRAEDLVGSVIRGDYEEVVLEVEGSSFYLSETSVSVGPSLYVVPKGLSS